MFLRVSSNFLCAGIIVRKGIVVKTAPIFYRVRGWKVKKLFDFLIDRGFIIEYLGP